MYRTKVLRISSNAVNDVYDVLSSQTLSGKVLYISDKIVDELYGGIVKAQLREIGAVEEMFASENSIGFAMKVAEQIISSDICCIVGLGGGKVLDICKYAAFISKTPFLSLPTTAANDGLASPIAVLKDSDGKPKSLGCAVPSMLLIDTGIIVNSPLPLIRAGIGDTISNYTALLDWELACARGKDVMNEYAYLMSRISLDTLMNTRYSDINQEFVDILLHSIVLSGIAMEFAGSSRPVSGSEHLFSHALDFFCNKQNFHGVQTALGTVIMLKLIGKDATDVINYLDRFKVDINPKHLGIDEASFVYCLQNATRMRNNRYTYLNETDLATPILTDIYKELTDN
jgi:glycerol-1-phosphate dehydrogenase [NAD(P)+]